VILPDEYGTRHANANFIPGGFFSRDGSVLVAGSSTSPAVTLWNMATGNKIRTFSLDPLKELSSGALSPDGTLLAVIEQIGVKTFERQVYTAVERRGSAAAEAVAQSRNSMGMALKLIDVSATGHGAARTLDTDTGARLALVRPAFSPDGRVLACGGKAGQIQLWNVPSGDNLPPLTVPAQGIALETAFSPDGSLFAAAHVSPGFDGQAGITLWDFRTRAVLRTLHKDRTLAAMAMAFSADGTSLAVASANSSVTLLDSGTGRDLTTFSIPPSPVRALAFSRDGKVLVIVSGDGGTRVWDAHSGEMLLSLVSLNRGADWLAVTPEGLFDGSPGAWSQIQWRFSENVLDVAPVEAFFYDFFHPGLLAEIVAGKRPHPAQNIADKDRRQPRVQLSLANALASAGTPIATRTIDVRVNIDQAAAGAHDVRLFRNGSLVKVWRGDVLKGQTAIALDATIPVVAGENRLSAYAFNQDGIKSLDADLTVRGADSLKRRGVAYILAIGVNAYSNSSYNLRYAEPDALAFAEELKRQQEELGVYQRVEVIQLLNERATRAAILEALDRLAAVVQPEDAAILYYAGHGTAYQSSFYLIPHDLGYTGERTALTETGFTAMLQHGISVADLERAVERIDTANLILVIDACNSGQVLEAEEVRRGPMNSKGLAQLAYEKGMYILTAAQSYQAAGSTTCTRSIQLWRNVLTPPSVRASRKAVMTSPTTKVRSAYPREPLQT